MVCIFQCSGPEKSSGFPELPWLTHLTGWGLKYPQGWPFGFVQPRGLWGFNLSTPTWLVLGFSPARVSGGGGYYMGATSPKNTHRKPSGGFYQDAGVKFLEVSNQRWVVTPGFAIVARVFHTKHPLVCLSQQVFPCKHRR